MSHLSLFLSGLPGRMATAVAEAALESSDIQLEPLALTGSSEAIQEIASTSIELIHHKKLFSFLDAIKAKPGAIIVDYTHPNAVKNNVEFYTQHKVPFVLGTTGGDYIEIEKMVVDTQTPAIVAPNMALPIVAIMTSSFTIFMTPHAKHNIFIIKFWLTIFF